MNKKTIIAVVALVLAVVLVGGTYYLFGMPQTQAGAKALTVSVVLTDGTSTDFEVETSDEFLGSALSETGLIKGDMGDYGLFVTEVNGVVVDDSKQQWWCLTKGGETVMTSFDTTPIADGDVFEITLTEGY